MFIRLADSVVSDVMLIGLEVWAIHLILWSFVIGEWQIYETDLTCYGCRSLRIDTLSEVVVLHKILRA